MDLGLTGKVAIVAAASKGLGKACALALAREGARVTICARTEGDLAAAEADIKGATGADVLAMPADVTSATDIHAVVEATAERFGGIDILVNNSGGPRIGRFGNLTDEDWRQAFEVVTLNFVRFVRDVVPYMRARHWGRIVGIQSSSVKQPVANIDLSNGTRPGIAGLMKALMPDLAADGITINLVLPGSFRTARISPGLKEGTPASPELQEQLKSLGAGIPVGRLGSPSSSGISSPSWHRSALPTSPGPPTRSTAASSPRICSSPAGNIQGVILPRGATTGGDRARPPHVRP